MVRTDEDPEHGERDQEIRRDSCHGMVRKHLPAKLHHACAVIDEEQPELSDRKDKTCDGKGDEDRSHSDLRVQPPGRPDPTGRA
jgi:hypothetical protein